MASDTSIAALFKPATQSLHQKMEEAVLEHLGRGIPLTRQKLAAYIGKPINCITAPVKSLLKAGLIVEHERVRNPQTKCLNWSLKIKENE